MNAPTMPRPKLLWCPSSVPVARSGLSGRLKQSGLSVLSVVQFRWRAVCCRLLICGCAFMIAFGFAAGCPAAQEPTANVSPDAEGSPAADGASTSKTVPESSAVENQSVSVSSDGDSNLVEPTNVLGEDEGVVSQPADALPPEPPPFDFDPYRVLIWVAAYSSQVNADTLREPLMENLDRDFEAIWRTDVTDAPTAVGSIALRDMASMGFDSIAATDPVVAVKRDHPDVVRMQYPSDVARYAQAIYSTAGRLSDTVARVEAQGEMGQRRFDWIEKVQTVRGDASAIIEKWNQPQTEAILVSRGIAETLGDKEAKIASAKMIVPPIDGQVVNATEQYDKIFVVAIHTATMPTQVEVVELDTLMRHFSQVSRGESASRALLPAVVGRAIRDAFSPVVRIDDAGRDHAKGLVRASGLILDQDSPALIRPDDVLQPMIRKDDRNGNPFAIGPLDWAYLVATESDGRRVSMDFYSGRAGGLQGRSNSRTFRMGLKVKPKLDATLLRLHAQNKPELPLIGYEIYERELQGKSMTFVGRTDWNGRLLVRPDQQPMRLLYVKNGGAVLARLPMVPGHSAKAVADLAGDDMRLQAEAYIRGVQNAIIDLVALRELFRARIMMRLREGKMEEADKLLQTLRDQPSNEELANEMGKRQSMFLKAIGRNPNQQRKVDNMFSTTRELLSKHINRKLVRDLEDAYIKAKKNGGKLSDP